MISLFSPDAIIRRSQEFGFTFKHVGIVARGNSRSPLILNSIPKSGTNLLTRVFYSSGAYRRSFQRTLEETTWKKAVRLRSNQFAPAHVPYSSEFSDLIGSRYKHVLIVRHPFDVAVSALHYIQSSKSRHRLNNFFSNGTLSFSDKLRFIIEGIPSEKLNGQRASKPLVEIYDSYSPWLNDGNTLVVKFEDLVGIGGGGSEDVQRSAINTIFSFIGLSHEYLPSGGQVFSKSSRTFRSGQIDGYRQLLEVDWSDFRDPEFVSVAGRFGYSL